MELLSYSTNHSSEVPRKIEEEGNGDCWCARGFREVSEKPYAKLIS